MVPEVRLVLRLISNNALGIDATSDAALAFAKRTEGENRRSRFGGRLPPNNKSSACAAKQRAVAQPRPKSNDCYFWDTALDA